MLLDTHSLLWVLSGGAEFGASARTALEGDPEVTYSSVSVAEIRIKQLLGKLQVPEDLLDRISAAGLRARDLTVAAADGLAAWPTLRRHDPFDRLLLAHAVAIGTRLLTADRVLLELDGAPVLDARA